MPLRTSDKIAIGVCVFLFLFLLSVVWIGYQDNVRSGSHTATGIPVGQPGATPVEYAR